MMKFSWSRLALAALALAIVAAPVEAQQRYRGGGGGFFDQLFGPGPSYQYEPQQQQQSQPQADYSRAPPPPRSSGTPAKVVMVLGDSMADWLAYGLEDALSENSELGVVRKHRTNSGLIRYEPRGDSDWAKVARETLSKERADYIVMMIGLNDRTSLREPTRVAPKKEQPAGAPAAADNAQQQPAQQQADAEKKPDSDDDDSIIAPEPTGRRGGGNNEFRSDRWAELYGKKIDEMIAALKSKGVPVFWVGLPAVRGTRSTSDVSFLNDLYRGHAEKAGITYIDVWDGFVDEGGRYAQSGPDFEGQNRRLRAYDGVHFTKAGARKLAHYVDRELQRVMTNRATPVALPSEPLPGSPQQAGVPAGPAARPLAGAVIPLSAPSGSEELLGAGPRNTTGAADQTAARVLVKGEPPSPAPGRADDFAWPRGQVAPTEAIAPVPVAADPAPAPVSRTVAAPAAKPQPAAKQNNFRPQRSQTQTAQQRPPPAQQRPRSNDLFGLFR